jgi:serpin B
VEGETPRFDFLYQFMNKTAKALFLEEENYIYSPISLYMALAMLAEGAEGETLSEILSLLEVEDLGPMRTDMKSVYEHNHYANEYGTAQMANSIWIRYDLPVKEEYLDILANQYFAEAYGTEFDETGKENIIKWINTNTHDLLELTKDNYPLSSDLALLLLNTIYFDNKWDTEFLKSNNYLDDFDEIVSDVEYMKHTVSSRYYQGTDYEIVYDFFKNGNSIQYILPATSSSVDSLLQSDILTLVIDDYAGVEATISVPKFSTRSSYQLNDTLIDMGCGRMFTDFADFSKLSDHPLLVSFVKQDAGIILSEEGVKAAAVSGIGMTESVAATNRVDIVLNRPFIYVIYDSDEVPLFVGVLNNPQA